MNFLLLFIIFLYEARTLNRKTSDWNECASTTELSQQQKYASKPLWPDFHLVYAASKYIQGI